LRFGQVTADEADDFNAVDVLDAVEVFDAEGAGASKGYFDGHGSAPVGDRAEDLSRKIVD
jgi:hypothetical protein